MMKNTDGPKFVPFLFGELIGVKKATAHRGPATACTFYNRGGMLAKNYDTPELMQKALDLLLLSAQIYMENGRIREAGYAMTSAAEAYAKLGDIERAKESLEIASSRLDKKLDDKVFEAIKRIEEKIIAQQGEYNG